jgi:hypothetical protein
VTGQTTTKGAVCAPQGAENYGLHAGVLGPIETLAQSVSTIAPSTSPALLIPVVFALAGNATWFVYLLSSAATPAGWLLRQPVRSAHGLSRIALYIPILRTPCRRSSAPSPRGACCLRT